MIRRFVILSTILLAFAMTFCAVADDADRASKGAATVVWISVDGIRPDYLDRGETPFFDRLVREGAYSRAFVPGFPSLTFPSHVTQVTGVTVEKHGVPGNSFIDSESWAVHRYPWDGRLLEAEPIWRTASRQDVRVAVFDWPLSHSQRGRDRAEYFGQRYIGGMSDEERLDQLIGAWEGDDDDTPLRLLMGYVVGPDSVGHGFGPDADEPVEKLEEVDGLLAKFTEKAVKLWQRTAGEGDELYLLITTDHGMSAVHTLVHLDHLADIGEDEDITTTTSGNTGHMFFRDRETVKNDPGRVEAIIARINAQDFAKAYRRADLPKEWGISHATRTGDIFVMLETGYTFSRRPRSPAVTGAAEDHGGPLGMHGYDPATNREMLGFMVVWRYGDPLGGIDLGEAHSLQIHATVARLLGIEPAEGARKDAIELKAR